MAICKTCKQEMTDRNSGGCWETFVSDKHKLTIKRIPFKAIEGERCHDCGVADGQIHHNGCDMERCPRCGSQLITCDCGIHDKYPYIGKK